MARVLIIGPDPSARRELAQALAEEGCQVRAAAGDRDALAVLGQWLPDLLVLDITADGVSGASFLQARRATPAYARVPVVAVVADRDNERIAIEGGAEPIPRPIALDELLARVGRLGSHAA